MASTKRLKQGAQKLIEVNARVKSGEKVVIVTDRDSSEIVKHVAAAAASARGEVVISIMAPRKSHGEAPPAPVARAMKAADVIFSSVTTSITHTVAMKEALKKGARAILMTAWTVDMFGLPALLETDFDVQADVCRRLGRAFSEGNDIRLTSELGTDLTFSSKERVANVLTNVPECGELAPVPDIEVNVVPVEGTAQGVLVADASLPYLGIGILKEPIICEIEHGFVTKIEGGVQAKVFEKALKSHNDRNCFNVAELGVGLNPNARLTGVMLEDEGVLGTIHIGLGTNFTLGGKVVAPTHYDLLMWNPTIIVDDTVVQHGQKIHV